MRKTLSNTGTKSKGKRANANLQKENAQKALIGFYQAKIQELESKKSVVKSDNKIQEVKQYQQQIDSLQNVIKALK